MRALVVRPDEPSGLALLDVPEPVPAREEVLVDVTHISLNLGEVNAARSAATGSDTPHGWDAVGVVAAAAADGTGPAVGTRVVTFGYGGAWAQRRAVPVTELAEVPAGVHPAAAAAIPTAGVTALRALRAAGSLLGRRVLVTGASGGVGRFAVQLAARAGAYVIAASARTEGLTALGAHEVVTDLAGAGPLDVVLDNVGGPQLVQAWQLTVPGGNVQCVGGSSGQPATFPPYGTVGPAKSLTSFQVGVGFGADLAYLADLLARGELTVDLGWQGSWNEVDAASTALVNRQVTGKAVLTVD